MAQEGNSLQPSKKMPKPNYVGVYTQCLMFGIIVLIPSLRETLATPIVLDQYGLSPDDGVFYVSITLSVTGLLAIIIMMVVSRLTRNIDDRKVLVALGFAPLLLGLLFHYPIGNKPIVYANCSSIAPELSTEQVLLSDRTAVFSQQETFSNLSHRGTYYSDVIYSTTSEPKTTANFDQECYGCPYLQQPWCLDTPQITPPQLIASYLIMITGFAICISFSQSVYTKILGPTPLGLWMGLLAIMSSIARITGPIWLSYIYENYGTIYIYFILFGIESIAALLVVVAYKHIAPMKTNKVDVSPSQLTFQNPAFQIDQE